MPSRTTKKNGISGDPRKRAEAVAPPEPGEKYTPTAWGAGGSEFSDLQCPSGQVCLARRPGIEGLLKAGILHEMDVLTPMISQHRDRVNGKRSRTKEQEQNAQLAEMVKDPKKLDQMLHLVDRVACYVVVQPPLKMTPNDPTNRKPGQVYCDQVDLMDKMFILNYAVGGSRDLERFHGEFGSTLGDIQAVGEDGEGTQ